jgi:hypothetical protein
MKNTLRPDSRPMEIGTTDPRVLNSIVTTLAAEAKEQDSV